MIMNVEQHLPELRHLCLPPLACSPLTWTHLETNAFFIVIIISANNSFRFWLHRGKEGIVNFFAPVWFLPESRKKRLGLDYHCNEENNMYIVLLGHRAPHIVPIFRCLFFTLDTMSLEQPNNLKKNNPQEFQETACHCLDTARAQQLLLLHQQDEFKWIYPEVWWWYCQQQ